MFELLTRKNIIICFFSVKSRCIRKQQENGKSALWIINTWSGSLIWVIDSLIHLPTQPIDIKECVSSGTAPV